jgi:hypothetical protein
MGHIPVYWPQQLAAVVAIGALIAHFLTSSGGGFSTYFAFGSLLISWVSNKQTSTNATESLY